MKFYGVVAERENKERFVRIHNIKTHKTFLLTFQLGDSVEVTVQKPKKDRTNKQNAYYWGVVLDYIADYTGFETYEVHEEMKRMFNPKPSKFNPEVTVGGTTTKLTTDEFNEYIEKIIRWAAMTLGVVIPDPNEIP